MIEYKIGKKINIEDIIKIRIQYLREYHGNISILLEKELASNMDKYLRENLNINCFVVLAYDNDKIVSSAILNIFTMVPNLSAINSRYGEVYGVYTVPEYRNRGIATNLMNIINDKAKDLNLSFVQLDASKYGKKIYERCGYAIISNGYTEMRLNLNKN